MLAFNELNDLLEPVEGGIGCPCGRKAVFNESRKRWEHQGNPAPRQRLPETIDEFITQGGGTVKDREIHKMMTQNYDKMHMEAFDALTTNASDEMRTHLWDNKGYKDKSLEELQELIALMPKQSQNAPPTVNYFGGQGAPANNSTVGGVPHLLPPTLEFKKTGT